MTSVGHGQTSASQITFIIKNAGIGVDGTFDKISVDYKFDPENIDQSSFAVTIASTSINTGNKTRDKHLRKSKYFDVENYPNLTFKSARVEKTAEGYALHGDLTIKKTTRSVKIDFSIKKEGGKSFFQGALELDRRDYGVGRNHLILGDLVKIEIQVPYSEKGNSR